MAANMGVGVETPSSGRTGVVFVLVLWLVPPLLYRHMAAGPDQGPGKVAIRPYCPMPLRSWPDATRPRWPRPGAASKDRRFGHSVQTATLPGPVSHRGSPSGRDRILGEIAATAWPPQQHPGPFAKQQHGAAGTVP